MARHGFIRDKLELKSLILYISSHLSQPVELTLLAEMAMCDGAVDYFEFSDATAELVASGHLRLHDGLYVITNRGRQMAEICEESLPRSVVLRAQRALIATMARLRRDASIKTEVTQRDDQLFLSCSLEDDGGQILSLELLVPGQRQADLLAVTFRRQAEKIYNKILTVMLDPGWGDPPPAPEPGEQTPALADPLLPGQLPLSPEETAGE